MAWVPALKDGASLSGWRAWPCSAGQHWAGGAAVVLLSYLTSQYVVKPVT